MKFGRDVLLNFLCEYPPGWKKNNNDDDDKNNNNYTNGKQLNYQLKWNKKKKEKKLWFLDSLVIDKLPSICSSTSYVNLSLWNLYYSINCLENCLENKFDENNNSNKTKCPRTQNESSGHVVNWTDS